MRRAILTGALLLAALPAAAGTLDPRLAVRAAAAGPERVSVWVTFPDKGFTMAGRPQALAAAATALTPRSRARRLRAHVTPLVDELDVPVAAGYLKALRALGLEPRAVSRWMNRAAVRVPAAGLLELARQPFVLRVSPVERARVTFGGQSSSMDAGSRLPADAAGSGAPFGGPRTTPASSAGATALDHGLLEGVLQQIAVPALHDSSYTGQGVLIAILDDGFTDFDIDEALAGRSYAPGHLRDFVDGDTIVTGPTRFGERHGTIVMGCLAANLPGRYVGAAPGADYALARTEVDSIEKPVEMLNWSVAAEWADSLGADVISSSLGYSTFVDDSTNTSYSYSDLDGHTTEITRAAEIAAAKGILVVNAAGNEGQTQWLHVLAPADADGDSLIAVGAVRADGTPAGFSSHGPTFDGRIKPDLSAPGVSVPVVGTSGDPLDYSSNSGTSLAAPLVAGLAACLLQARPAWTPRDVIRALRATASRAATPDNDIGYGIPNGRLAAGLPAPLRLAGHGRVAIGLSGARPLRLGDRTQATFLLRSGGAVHARVRVLDTTGRAITTLWSDTLVPGPPQTVDWDGHSDGGRALAPGLYWIAIAAGGDVAAARVVFLR